MRVVIIACCLLVAVGSYAQSKNELFERSKGTLSSGLKSGIKLDMTKIDEAMRPKNAVYVTYSADSARAVFDGTVTDIVEIPGHAGDYAVVISYGDYTISYTFLLQPVVKAGDRVRQGQLLGALSPVPMGPRYLMIQIYKGEDELAAWEWFKK